MIATVGYRSGSASDPGLVREENEDRVYADESRGIFLVVDGMGGRAAGETAAQTAVDVIARYPIESERDVAEAITAANNQIHRLAQEREACRGMAWVLTLAVAREDRITVGHVGDSRLYLIWNGTIRKLTSDHSPVGELEDSGNSPKRKRWRILNGMKYFAMWVRELANFRTMISLNLSRFASKPARHCYFARTV